MYQGYHTGQPTVFRRIGSAARALTVARITHIPSWSSMYRRAEALAAWGPLNPHRPPPGSSARTGKSSWRRRYYPGRIATVTKLSVSLPDDLVQDLRAVAHDNVSAFVTSAVRHELDRRRLSAFVDELADELGPIDEAEVARYSELFASTAAVSPEPKTASR